MIKLIECPRDAMQGIKPFISTATKAAYLNRLLRVGFDTLDFGSFVSPKAIPQMRDTSEVLSLLNFEGVSTRLLAIVANARGAESAAAFQRIDYLGYPFSVSETFQLRNTNATIADSLERVAEIQEICQESGKQLVVYLSMGFGNPYGDPWNVETVQRWVGRLAEMGVGIFQLSDTIGVATPASIAYLFGQLLPQYPDLEIGAHFHTQPHNWEEKIATAYQHGCRRFDGALRGYGGCPMARDTLTGNMPTENMIGYLDEQGVCPELDREVLREAMDMAAEIFP